MTPPHPTKKPIPSTPTTRPVTTTIQAAETTIMIDRGNPLGLLHPQLRPAPMDLPRHRQWGLSHPQTAV